ncbi:hypothetical protein NDU88_000756 [Pleurodeles waltl]|uniref:Uncharacterized protein n=1 Tax=Pleurodeles waltl TaxID=8319 RepID=A0AAV7V5Z1_PLEWA|nr:hypothetical protein NDU88_000756 [Pleurodeles waltl]
MVGDTIPHHELPTALQVQASERLRQRGPAHEHMSRKRRTCLSPLQVGNRVLVQNRHPGEKFKLPFEMVPWTGVRTRSTMITVTRGGESVTRNISFFKRYQSEDATMESGTLESPSDSESTEHLDDDHCLTGLGEMATRGHQQEENLLSPGGSLTD